MILESRGSTWTKIQLTVSTEIDVSVFNPDGLTPSNVSPSPREDDVATSKEDSDSNGFEESGVKFLGMRPLRRKLFGDGLNAKLDAAEHQQNHRWSDKEIMALLILCRYYENDWAAFTTVLNRMYGGVAATENGRFRKGNATSRFSFLRKTKAWAEICCADRNKYAQYLRELEMQAAMVNVQLKRREGTMLAFTKADTTRSPRVKKEVERLDELLQKTHISSLTPAKVSAPRASRDSNVIATPPKGVGLSTYNHNHRTMASGSSSKSIMDEERQSLSTSPPPIAYTDEKKFPAFVYRCNNEQSAAQMTDLGFVSEGFLSNPRDYLNVRIDVKDFIFQERARRHIWDHEWGSPLLSTSTSLFETFRRANQYPDSSSISVINYNAIKDRSISALEVIPLLKRNGWVQGMYYKGSCEHLTIGYIPAIAIVHSFKYSDLKRRLEGHDLSLEERLAAGVGVSALRKQLFRDTLRLTPHFAISLDTVVSMFGVSQISEEELVEEIVSKLIDALVINLYDTTGINELVQAFMTAVVTIPDGTPTLVQDEKSKALHNGFLKGVAAGLKKLGLEKKKIDRRSPRSQRMALL